MIIISMEIVNYNHLLKKNFSLIVSRFTNKREESAFFGVFPVLIEMVREYLLLIRAKYAIRCKSAIKFPLFVIRIHFKVCYFYIE